MNELRAQIEKKSAALNETCCLLYEAKREVKELKEQLEEAKKKGPIVVRFPAFRSWSCYSVVPVDGREHGK